MTTSLDPDAATRLAAAKLWLTSTEAADLPYLSTAVYAFQAVASRRVAGMAADAHWRLYLNPDWLGRTAVPVIGTDLAHLAWHLLAEHPARAHDLNVTTRTAHHWRTASDCALHGLLSHVPGLPLASPGSRAADRFELPTARDQHLPPDWSAEQYYAALSGLPASTDAGVGRPDDRDDPESPDLTCGSCSDGLARGHEVTEPPAVHDGAAQAIRATVAQQLREHSSWGRGDLPGELTRWVQHVLEPAVDWRLVLAAAVRRGIGWAAGHDEYTYRRISRRHGAAHGVILPGTRRRVPRVAVVVDTSGSMDDPLLAQAVAEVDGVLKSGGIADTDLTVLAVDAAVHTLARVRDATSIGLRGGGGTDMRVGIDAALTSRPRPELLIVLTDGYTPWPQHPSPVPLIVALLHHNTNAPPTPHWVHRVDVTPNHQTRCTA